MTTKILALIKAKNLIAAAVEWPQNLSESQLLRLWLHSQGLNPNTAHNYQVITAPLIPFSSLENAAGQQYHQIAGSH